MYSLLTYWNIFFIFTI